MIIPLFQLLLCLSGREEDPSDIQSGKAIEMLSLVPGGESAILGKESLMSYGMQLSVYMGDFERATKYYEQLKDANMGIMKASCIYHARLFFFSLICLENFRTHRRSRFKNEAKKHIGIIRELVESGAINLVHKLQLLDAEFSSVTSKDTDEVLRKYEKAIVSGSRSGFLQDGALSNFLCAMFCLRNPGKVSAADSYIERAYELYKTWGARAVAKSVKERHPDFFPEAEPVDLNRGDSLFRSRAQFRESFALMHKSLSVALINVKK